MKPRESKKKIQISPEGLAGSVITNLVPAKCLDLLAIRKMLNRRPKALKVACVKYNSVTANPTEIIQAKYLSTDRLNGILAYCFNYHHRACKKTSEILYRKRTYLLKETVHQGNGPPCALYLLSNSSRKKSVPHKHVFVWHACVVS